MRISSDVHAVNADIIYMSVCHTHLDAQRHLLAFAGCCKCQKQYVWQHAAVHAVVPSWLVRIHFFSCLPAACPSLHAFIRLLTDGLHKYGHATIQLIIALSLYHRGGWFEGGTQKKKKMMWSLTLKIFHTWWVRQMTRPTAWDGKSEGHSVAVAVLSSVTKNANTHKIGTTNYDLRYEVPAMRITQWLHCFCSAGNRITDYVHTIYPWSVIQLIEWNEQYTYCCTCVGLLIRHAHTTNMSRQQLSAGTHSWVAARRQG